MAGPKGLWVRQTLCRLLLDGPKTVSELYAAWPTVEAITPYLSRMVRESPPLVTRLRRGTYALTPAGRRFVQAPRTGDAPTPQTPP